MATRGLCAIFRGSRANTSRAVCCSIRSSRAACGSTTSTTASPTSHAAKAFAVSSNSTELRHPPLARDHVDAPHRLARLGDLALESGDRIVDYQQSYVTHGALDAQKSNAVLICASLTGTHHRLDFLIGPGKALDPARWFVVATDPIGNGLSTSPSNSTAHPRMAFPQFSLRDMIHAQHRLLVEHLGLTNVRAVIGASMGGMQALQWAVSHPRFMQCVIAMTPM